MAETSLHLIRQNYGLQKLRKDVLYTTAENQRKAEPKINQRGERDLECIVPRIDT